MQKYGTANPPIKEKASFKDTIMAELMGLQNL